MDSNSTAGGTTPFFSSPGENSNTFNAAIQNTSSTDNNNNNDASSPIFSSLEEPHEERGKVNPARIAAFKSRGKSDQERRREEFLQKQKQKRRNMLDLARELVTTATVEDIPLNAEVQDEELADTNNNNNSNKNENNNSIEVNDTQMEFNRVKTSQSKALKREQDILKKAAFFASQVHNIIFQSKQYYDYH